MSLPNRLWRGMACEDGRLPKKCTAIQLDWEKGATEQPCSFSDCKTTALHVVASRIYGSWGYSLQETRKELRLQELGDMSQMIEIDPSKP